MHSIAVDRITVSGRLPGSIERRHSRAAVLL